MENFTQMRLDGLMAFGVHAPLETCTRLVEEMSGSVSLGTRLEALSILGGVAQELSGMRERKNRQLEIKENQA